MSAYDCKARLATLEDLPAIVDFYQNHRTKAVYLRKPAEIEAAINNELFVIVENPQSQIIAASGIYLLNGGTELEECIVEDRRTIRSTVAELGSVLRWPEGLPEDKQVEGVWHPFLFGVPMVLLLQRMLKCSMSVDTLVCDVQTDRVSNIQRLLGQVDLTPLRWHMIQPGRDLLDAFKSTVKSEDKNVDNPKLFFQGLVSNLPRVADYLLQVCEYGLSNRAGEILTIDMTDLVKNWTVGIDKEGRRHTILGKLTENRQTIEQLGNLGWREFARHFHNKYAPRKGIAINGPYRVPADQIQNFSKYADGMLTPSAGGGVAVVARGDSRPEVPLNGLHV